MAEVNLEGRDAVGFWGVGSGVLHSQVGVLTWVDAPGFRAVIFALAGTSKMPLPPFLGRNAGEGIVWGVGFVVLGFVAGACDQRVVAKQADMARRSPSRPSY